MIISINIKKEIARSRLGAQCNTQLELLPYIFNKTITCPQSLSMETEHVEVIIFF